jgi:hypothetical protein
VFDATLGGRLVGFVCGVIFFIVTFSFHVWLSELLEEPVSLVEVSELRLYGMCLVQSFVLKCVMRTDCFVPRVQPAVYVCTTEVAVTLSLMMRQLFNNPV